MRQAHMFAVSFVLLLRPGVAQVLPGTTNTGDISPLVSQTMKSRTKTYVCGGRVQAGTPIAGNGTLSANGTSGLITIKDLPSGARIMRADLFWSVLTYDTAATLPMSSIGREIFFNGNPVSGVNVGRAAASPCFPQTAALGWTADVRSLIAQSGNGSYTVSGFPGGSNFTEGVTLQILYADPNRPLMEDNLYHSNPDSALAVTASNWFMQMSFGGDIRTNAQGPVSASLFPVVGNGQVTGLEKLLAHGPCGAPNVGQVFTGSTTAKAANTCQSSMGSDCFWDDGVINFNDIYACPKGNAANWWCFMNPSPSYTPPRPTDCLTYVAMAFMNTTDEKRVCDEGGKYVDQQCPVNGPWRNHGEYVACVAQAASEFLVGLPEGGTCPRDPIHSCIVSMRASNPVGR